MDIKITKYLLIFSLVTNALLLFRVLNRDEMETEPVKEEPTKEEIEENPTINIVMLGNSITAQGNWAEVLGREDVFNGGMPGWTTQQLSWVIKNYIGSNRPKLCFFKGGINDYTLGITTDRIVQNISQNLDSINALGTMPVYQTTLYQRGNIRTNREIDTLNMQMERFCAERGYEFLDLRPFLCKDGDILDEYIQDDNTHLQPGAYTVWAEALKPILKKYELD